MCDIDKKKISKFSGIFTITIIRQIFAECVELQDCLGQLTPKVFDSLYILSGQFIAVTEINIFQQVYSDFDPLWTFFTL